MRLRVHKVTRFPSRGTRNLPFPYAYFGTAALDQLVNAECASFRYAPGMHLLTANAIFEFALSFQDQDFDPSLSERPGERSSGKAASNNNDAAAHAGPPLSTVVLDLAPFRYLSHFITPPSSPIRFTARFFLAPVPAGQEPRLLGGEASEGFWIDPAEGHRRFLTGEMQMAEPADCGLRYLAGFDDLESLWTAHTDGRHKFHGITDRIEAAGFSIPRSKRSGQP